MAALHPGALKELAATAGLVTPRRSANRNRMPVS